MDPLKAGLPAATKERPDGHNHKANRNGEDDWVAPGWAFARPTDRRLMNNRTSADPQRQPLARGLSVTSAR